MGRSRRSRNECAAMVELNAFFIICELGRGKGFRDLNKGEDLHGRPVSHGEQQLGMKATAGEEAEAGFSQTLVRGFRAMLMPSVG